MLDRLCSFSDDGLEFIEQGIDFRTDRGYFSVSSLLPLFDQISSGFLKIPLPESRSIRMPPEIFRFDFLPETFRFSCQRPKPPHVDSDPDAVFEERRQFQHAFVLNSKLLVRQSLKDRHGISVFRFGLRAGPGGIRKFVFGENFSDFAIHARVRIPVMWTVILAGKLDSVDQVLGDFFNDADRGRGIFLRDILTVFCHVL